MAGETAFAHLTVVDSTHDQLPTGVGLTLSGPLAATTLALTGALTSTGGALTVGDGTAGDGSAVLTVSNIGVQVSGVNIYKSTADTQPVIALLSVNGAGSFNLGPGGSTAADVVLARSGAAAATFTGSFTGNNKIVSTSPTAGIGYATGAGGTVTQATSRTTTVVLNTLAGTITLFSTTLAADTDVSFTWTNSAIAATDVVITDIKSGAAVKGGYAVNVICGAGTATVTVRNLTPTITATEAPVISFVVIKGVTS